MRKDSVSVILPTSNRYHVVFENIENILKQDYPDFEIIVCDDSDAEYYKSNSADFIKKIEKYKNVKYIYVARFNHEGKKDYGLARARNFGVVASEGEYLVFLDDRITPNCENLISTFVGFVKETKKIWYFGDKGAHKTSFVENCSCIRRSEMVDAGMFNERIDKYGGMSRELIARYAHQGFKFQFVPAAIAKQCCKSDGWERKTPEVIEMKDVLKRLFDR